MAEGVFPIIDRDTPVIDRIRERRNGKAKEKDGIAGALVESLTASSEDTDKIQEELEASIKEEIADGLGVDEDKLRERPSNELAAVATSFSVEDVLTEDAMVELGLTVGGDTDEDSGDEDDEKF